jgi:hypothetical protein
MDVDKFICICESCVVDIHVSDQWEVSSGVAIVLSPNQHSRWGLVYLNERTMNRC